jgi:hypothetical protein
MFLTECIVCCWTKFTKLTVYCITLLRRCIFNESIESLFSLFQQMSENKISDVLDDDFLDDSQFDDSLLSTQNTNRIVHSATSDTLDSVVLEPMTDELSLLEDVSEGIRSSTEEMRQEDAGIEIAPSEGSNNERGEDQSADVPVNVETSAAENVEEKPQGSPVKEAVNISSYFTSEGQENDPFSALNSGKNQEEDIFGSIGTSKVEDNTPITTELGKENFPDQTQALQSEIGLTDDVIVHHDVLEKRISKETAESVEFQVVPESDVNIMEASMQLIDDKEDFESFTAESGTADIDQVIGGITELQLSERHRTTSETNHPEYNTQLSVSSQHSQNAAPTPPMIPSPVNQPFNGTPLSGVNVSPLLTSSKPVLPTSVSGKLKVSLCQASI